MLCFVIQTMYFYPKQQILCCLSLEPSDAALPPPSLTPFHACSCSARGFNKELQSYLCQHLLLWFERFGLVGKSEGLKSTFGLKSLGLIRLLMHEHLVLSELSEGISPAASRREWVSQRSCEIYCQLCRDLSDTLVCLKWH